jgi:hypothetical protein
MKQLTIYRILTFILLPFAALFGAIGFFMLLVGLSNPQVLFSAFILAGFVIYLFSSLRFLLRGIDTGKPCKVSLRDWIRVNGFVSIVLVFSFLQSAATIFFSSKEEIKKLYDQSVTIQPEIPKFMNLNLYVTMMHAAAYFLLFMGILLLIHIPLTFRLLKKYVHLFSEPKPE